MIDSPGQCCNRMEMRERRLRYSRGSFAPGFLHAKMIVSAHKSFIYIRHSGIKVDTLEL